MKTLTHLDLWGTGFTDLTQLPRSAEFAYINLTGTHVADLRPLRDLRYNSDVSEINIRIQDTPATRADPRLAAIAEMENDAERSATLLDYLKDWVPLGLANESEDKTDAALAILPAPKPAPLSLAVSIDRLDIAEKEGLPESKANDRAAMGWEALHDFRQDFATAFNVSNYTPLPAYLTSFDRAMGTEYDPARVIKIGIQAQRMAQLALDTTFTQNLPDGALSDLKLFASEAIVYVNRFPDWVAYRDDSDVISPSELQEEQQTFEEIRDALTATKGVTDEVTTEYAAEVDEAMADSASEIEATGLHASTREMARSLAEYETNRLKETQARNRSFARKGGDLADSVINGTIGVPYHVAKKLEGPARRLARRFPASMGFVETWYDLTFGPEDKPDDHKD